LLSRISAYFPKLFPYPKNGSTELLFTLLQQKISKKTIFKAIFLMTKEWILLQKLLDFRTLNWNNF